LIREVGRRPTPGRPVLFGTTELFLRYFGLNDLTQLPLMGERGVQALLDVAREG
jgi:chromosome segregation and condensation protein ScpB